MAHLMAGLVFTGMLGSVVAWIICVVNFFFHLVEDTLKEFE